MSVNTSAETALYLDNLSTMRLHPAVRAAMQPLLDDCFGNASSVHKLGRLAREALDKARNQVAALLGAQPQEIYFTGSGTISNNTALLGRARYCAVHGIGKHIVTSTTEHAAVSEAIKFLESDWGWKVSRIEPPTDASIDSELLQKHINSDTTIISLSAANAYSGAMLSVAEIAALASDRKIFFHSDAALLPARTRIDVNALGVSALSLSGHKFRGPKGVGVLYLQRGVSVMPTIFGGGQEMGLFPGTESLPLIVGLGAAAEAAYNLLDLEDKDAKLLLLQQALIASLDDRLSKRDLSIIGPSANRLLGHVSVRCRDSEAAKLVADSLARHSVFVGTENDAVIVQFDFDNTVEDCNRIGDLLAQVVETL